MRQLVAILLLSTSTQAAEIPLKSIYSTSPQKGLRATRPTTDVFGISQANRRSEAGGGPSNVFLVDAKTIDDAITATRRTHTGQFRIGRPANGADDPSGNYWFVAFLGTAGSTPIRWTVDSVEVDGNRIRFTYHLFRPPAQGYGGTGDHHHYFYWIPLGDLEPGAYRLELFDGKDVTLMRRVEVSE